MFLKKVSLTNRQNVPCALSNVGDALQIQDTIGNTLADTKAKDKYELAKEVSNRLNALPHRLCWHHNWTVHLPYMKSHNDNVLCLHSLDPLGNIDILYIEVEGKYEENCNIHNFYISSEIGSGLKYNNIEAFIDAIRYEIQERAKAGADDFSIIIEEVC